MQLTNTLTSTTPSPKVIKRTDQIKFLTMLGQLLDQGFSMKESLVFLHIVLGKKNPWIADVTSHLEAGHRLDEALKDQQFPAWICSQLYFAHHHGHLAESLIQCGKQMQIELDRQKELGSLLTYPIFLIMFMVGMLMALRFILLPQFQSMVPQDQKLAQAAVQFIYYSPHLILGCLGLSLGLTLYVRHYQKKHSAMDLARLLSRIPILSPYVKIFYTYRFTKEWSALLESGLSMQELVGIMTQKETTALMQDIGTYLQAGLIQGQALDQIMGQFSFFKAEYADVILHGQKIGALADSLAVYAEQCLSELDTAVKKVFALVQPVLFVLIAALLVVIYGSMLLPMFSFMDTL